jgi:hypothetical protein
MMKPEQIRVATDALLSAGSIQESIASIRTSINQLLNSSDGIYALDPDDSFRVAWTIAAAAGSLVTGVTGLLNAFQGLVDQQQIDETRALLAQFGRHVQGSPAELLTDRGRLLAELELKLEDLSDVVRDQASRAPAGVLLADSDYSALLG